MSTNDPSMNEPLQRQIALTQTAAFWFCVVLTSLLVAAELSGEPARLALRYERDAIAAGEWWRLITGHFVHLGRPHAAWNIAGLCIMGSLFKEEIHLRQWWAITVTGLFFISAGLWFIAPSVSWYVGFSGVLHTILVFGLLQSRYVWPRHIWLLLIVAVVVKLVYEVVFGALPMSEQAAGGAVVVQAHWLGALAGLFCFWAQKTLSSRQEST